MHTPYYFQLFGLRKSVEGREAYLNFSPAFVSRFCNDRVLN